MSIKIEGGAAFIPLRWRIGGPGCPGDSIEDLSEKLSALPEKTQSQLLKMFRDIQGATWNGAVLKPGAIELREIRGILSDGWTTHILVWGAELIGDSIREGFYNITRRRGPLRSGAAVFCPVDTGQGIKIPLVLSFRMGAVLSASGDSLKEEFLVERISPGGNRELVDLRSVLTHGYRLEIPKGFVLPGETPETAAIREATEEIGLDTISSNPCALHVADYEAATEILAMVMSIVVLSAATLGGPRENMEESAGEVYLLSLEQLRELVKRRVITDGYTLAALGAAWANGLL